MAVLTPHLTQPTLELDSLLAVSGTESDSLSLVVASPVSRVRLCLTLAPLLNVTMPTSQPSGIS